MKEKAAGHVEIEMERHNQYKNIKEKACSLTQTTGTTWKLLQPKMFQCPSPGCWENTGPYCHRRSKRGTPSRIRRSFHPP